jgi:hypothetical protein
MKGALNILLMITVSHGFAQIPYSKELGVKSCSKYGGLYVVKPK